MLSTTKSLVIGSIKKLAKLQKNSYSFNANISFVKYVPDMNIFVALFDDFTTGKLLESIQSMPNLTCVESFTGEGESKVVLFNLDSSSSSKGPEILDDSITLQKSEFAVNMLLRKANDEYYVYVLTVDLTSHDETSLIEKRGRILCFQLIQSSEGSKSKSTVLTYL